VSAWQWRSGSWIFAALKFSFVNARHAVTLLGEAAEFTPDFFEHGQQLGTVLLQCAQAL
jgi:hypothetical protein